MTKAIYAGTFDPITTGHMDIIHRSMKFCDELVIAIGINPQKNSMFTEEERIKQITVATDNGMAMVTNTKLTVVSFQGLLVEYAKQIGADILVRGIRSVSDFEYEINLSGVNKTLEPTIETVFLPTSPHLAVVSSSMVKEVARHGGDISRFVPKGIAKAVNDKFGFIKLSNPAKNKN
jgi:pantetheine-phosphate adenylyltransferase